MIIGLVAFIISFVSGSLGVLNIIGSGFVFIFINTVVKLANGPDSQWRIHLANFFISSVYVIFNFNKIFRHIFYLLGTLVTVAISWGLGKILLNQFDISNFKFIALLTMIILASVNIKKSESITEANDTMSDVGLLKADDFFIISFCSFISSYFEINFGAIACLIFITVKKKIKLLDLSNVVYFSMLLYSVLNLIWYLIKKEIVYYKELEFFIFPGLIFGAIFSMLFRSNIQEKILSKIILISIFIYSIILFFYKALI